MEKSKSLATRLELGEFDSPSLSMKNLTRKQLTEIPLPFKNSPLHYACQHAKLDYVRWFIGNMALDANSANAYGQLPLHVASRTSCLEAVKLLVEVYQCDPICRDFCHSTPLHYAASAGQYEVVKYFTVTLQIDPQVQDKNLFTPLHAAALGGHLGIVRFLTEYLQCDSSLADSTGIVPLHLASQNGHLDVVQYLGNIGSLYQDSDGATPLHFAAANGQVEVVRYLTTILHVDSQSRDTSGRLPLHDAALSGHLEVVQFLTGELNCDINSVDNLGRNVLHFACESGNLDVVKHLIKSHQLDLLCKDGNGASPLHLAAATGQLEVVRYFVSTLQNYPIMKDKYGRSPLHEAAQSGHMDVILFFAEQVKCHFGVTDNSGRQPLHLACESGKLDVVRYLVESVLYLTDPMSFHDHDHATPLYYAVSNGHLEVIKHSKTLPQAADRLNRTPLTCAASGEYKEIVEFLLQNGARDHKGLACQIAFQNDRSDLVQLILSYHSKEGESGSLILDWSEKNLLSCLGEWFSEFYLHVSSMGTRRFQTGAVSLVNLSSNHLRNVPIELFQLQNVKEIDLASNEITELPSAGRTPINSKISAFSIVSGWTCTKLERLYMSHNRLTDIPACVWSLPQLHVLVCSSNMLQTVHFPSSWDPTQGTLQDIDLASNQLSGTLSHYFFEMPNLCIFNLSSNMITDLPENLWKSKSLHCLYLFDNQLSYLPFCRLQDELSFHNEYNHLGNAVNTSKSSLLQLSLSRNQFEHFPKNLAYFAPSLVLFEIANNPCIDVDGEFIHALAARHDADELVLFLIQEFFFNLNCMVNGRTLLHSACSGGNTGLVRKLILDYNAEVDAVDDQGNTPLAVAVKCGQEHTALALYSQPELKVKSYLNRTLLHIACSVGNIKFLRTLVLHHNENLYARDDMANTPLHVAALAGKDETVLTLLKEFQCKSDVKGYLERSLLHMACMHCSLSLVQILVQEYQADICAIDSQGNTPIHLAAFVGKEDIVMALITKFNCDPNIRGYENRSVMHSACVSGHAEVVQSLSRYISPFVVDAEGNTPLHVCAAADHTQCVRVLLSHRAPVLMRNNSGKTPLDIATGEAKSVLQDYMSARKGEIYCDYDVVQNIARKKYSKAECITRIFVIGNSGAGKSTLVETLKREAWLDKFSTVSASCVPLHTAGIIPSIFRSKLYGRVLFYDFAGDPEYYSSHAAILENLASSRKGNNIFIIVVDLREDLSQIRSTVNYWSFFIQNHKFVENHSCFIVAGSHVDTLKSSKDTRCREFQGICEKKLSHSVLPFSSFTLNCCRPQSDGVRLLQKKIVSLTKGSPTHKLSVRAITLLGLLEKDFEHVTCCHIESLISHINDTGIDLPNQPEALYPILCELHDIGLLFIVACRDRKKVQIILNISELTNKVHKLLFSGDSIDGVLDSASGKNYNIGIIPQSILELLLPEYITKECLVQLQYCQVIDRKDIMVFSSFSDLKSSDDFFLFFPAMCTAEKDEDPWNTPLDANYSIGWLAQCAFGNCFSPRFLHVLLLRLVFNFTLSVPSKASQDQASSDFQRRCSMWSTGVYWSMEEGVKCMVELVNYSRSIVLLSKSNNRRPDNFAKVFNKVVSCIKDTIAEFCNQIQPEFFLLDSFKEADYLDGNHLYAMSDVENALSNPVEKEVILSLSGKQEMAISKLKTIFNSISPLTIKGKPDMAHLENWKVIEKLAAEWEKFAYTLQLSYDVIQIIHRNTAYRVESSCREVFARWLSGEGCQPATWERLIEVLKDNDRGTLAEKLRQHFSEPNGQ